MADHGAFQRHTNTTGDQECHRQRNQRIEGQPLRSQLGQGYIIDSFLVVVLGGVGQLAGSVAAAFGLGIFNKILEPQMGAVLGKILILVLIILFIQKRPQGLFALKGRVID